MAITNYNITLRCYNVQLCKTDLFFFPLCNFSLLLISFFFVICWESSLIIIIVIIILINGL